MMICILFLAANPRDTTRLKLVEEFNSIDDMLQIMPDRDQFKLERYGMSTKKLQQLFLRFEPQILHFSGHGSDKGSLFQNEYGLSEEVLPPSDEKPNCMDEAVQVLSILELTSH